MSFLVAKTALTVRFFGAEDLSGRDFRFRWHRVDTATSVSVWRVVAVLLWLAAIACLFLRP